MNSTSATMSI